jgi:hypothetical protein
MRHERDFSQIFLGYDISFYEKDDRYYGSVRLRFHDRQEHLSDM